MVSKPAGMAPAGSNAKMLCRGAETTAVANGAGNAAMALKGPTVAGQKSQISTIKRHQTVFDVAQTRGGQVGGGLDGGQDPCDH